MSVTPKQFVQTSYGDLFYYVDGVMRGDETHFFISPKGYIFYLGEHPSFSSDGMSFNAPWCNADEMDVKLEELEPAVESPENLAARQEIEAHLAATEPLIWD